MDLVDLESNSDIIENKRLLSLYVPISSDQTTVLGLKGSDKFNFSNPNSTSNKSKLPIKLNYGAYGPQKIKKRNNKDLLKCVLIKKKYSKANPFKEIILKEVINKEKEGRVEKISFDRDRVYEISKHEEQERLQRMNRYFETYQNSHQTSDNTLSDLQTLEPNDILNGINQIKLRMHKTISFLESFHESLFQQYFFELNQGFNLLFYGYGSKRTSLLKFAEKFLTSKTSEVIVVNGYFPDLTIRSLVGLLCLKVFKIKPNLAKPLESIQLLQSHFPSYRKLTKVTRIYLVIHNIDGENLRNAIFQQFLILLSQLPFISIVASMDHVKATLLWDSSALSEMNFIFHEMTTYQPYQLETSYESSPLLPMGATSNHQLTIRGAIHVLKSVNVKAKGIFKLLLQEQLKAKPTSLPIDSFKDHEPDSFQTKKKPKVKAADLDQFGLSSDLLFSLGRRKFLVSTLTAFNANLREFFDHNLIKQFKDGNQTKLFIPMPPSALESLLDLAGLNQL